MSKPSAYIVIPARYQSSRFPGKPLTTISGKTLLERVWCLATASKLATQVIVATDDNRIFAHAKSFGAEVLMTPESCRNGTERVYATTCDFAQSDDIVLSLQGDAVLTPPWIIDNLIQSLIDNPKSGIATPAQKMTGQAIEDFLAHKTVSPSSGTCVVFDKNYQALYFSKQVIPYAHGTPTLLYRHIGLYAYKFAALEQLQALPPSPLEQTEKLEQLRALENNIAIQVVPVDYQGRTHGSIDTPEDVAFVENIIKREGELV